jgi:hypothetical protein
MAQKSAPEKKPPKEAFKKKQGATPKDRALLLTV